MNSDSMLSLDQSMIYDPSLVLYASVSKGSTVLAELSSGDHDLETLALKCLEKTPEFHIRFSHTIRKRIYSFLMEDPFVYFAILDEDLGVSQGFEFLERVKFAFLKILKKRSPKGGLSNLSTHCFHKEFDPVFRGLVTPSPLSESNALLSKNSRNSSLDSCSSGSKMSFSGLLGGKSRHSKKKKKKCSGQMDEKGSDIPTENKVDLYDETTESRDFSVTFEKNASYVGLDEHQTAHKRWRRHVWTVVSIDLVVCCVLFGVWLWICKGFECLAS